MVLKTEPLNVKDMLDDDCTHTVHAGGNKEAIRGGAMNSNVIRGDKENCQV